MIINEHRTMINFTKTLILSLALLFCVHSYAQHGTSSPYSMLGIGEIDNRSYGLNSGMANAGIGLSMPGFLNTANPAALFVDTLSFVFDLSMSGKFSQFQGSGKNEYATNANIRKVAFGVRTFPKLVVSMGLTPYSNMQYKIKSEGYIEGSFQKYNVYYEGSGGLSDLYLAASYKLFSGFHVGANMSYIFGRLNRTESVQSHSVQTSTEVDKIIFDFGLLYNKFFTNSRRLTVGAIYGYESEFKMKNYKTYTMTGTTKTKTSTYTSIPQYFGGGLSYQSVDGRSHKVFSIDYRFNNWANIKSPDNRMKYDNSHRVNAGVAITPNYRTPRNYFQRIQYQLGGYYEKSHLVINGHNVNEMGVTVGALFPIKADRTQIFFSADFGHRGGKGLINENFLTLNLGISMNQMWFTKWFYE